MGLRLLILCLSLAVLGVNDAWGAWTDTQNKQLSASDYYKENKWYVVYDLAEYSFGVEIKEAHEETFQGPGKKVSFKAHGVGSVLGGGKKNLYYRYYDNSGEHDVDLGTLDTKNYQPYSYDLTKDVTKISFVTKAGHEYNKYVKDVKVEMASYLYVTALDKASDSYDFGSAKINEADVSETFRIYYCNGGGYKNGASSATSLSISNTNTTNFSTSISSKSISAGSFGYFDLEITYNHKNAGNNQSATITVADGGGYSVNISVSGTTEKYDPTITWLVADQIANGEIIPENQVATTPNEGCTITFESSSTEVAKFENGNLVAVSAGDATITAHVYGTNVFADKDYTKTISVTNKTIQTITWSQSLTGLKTTDAPVQLNASASSGLACRYVSSDANVVSVSGSTLTIVGEGEAFVTAYQDGNGEYAAATPVEQAVLVFDPTQPCPSQITLQGSSVNIENTGKEYPVECPKKITFDEKSSSILTGKNLYVRQKVDGQWQQIYEQTDRSTSWKNGITITSANGLSIKATAIEIRTDATQGHDFRNLVYERETHTTPSIESLSFTAYVGTNPKDQTFTVDNANSKIFVSCTNANFTVSPSSFGDCGLYINQTITVGYNAPSEARTEPETGAIVFTNHMEQEVGRVSLSATVNKMDQQITSHNIGNSYKTTDKITLSAVVNSGLTDFTYTPSPSDVANVIGSVLTFNKSCDNLSITINQAGTSKYNPTSLVVNNITVSKVTPTIVTAPTATSIVYGTALAQSQLAGGLVKVNYQGQETTLSGSFNWAEVGAVKPAGATSYQVVWTPTETALYNTATTSVPITISKATPAITWNASEGPYNSKADIDVLTATSSNTDDATVSYAITSQTPAGIATISNGKLVTTGPGSVTVRATTATTGNFNVVTMDKTFTFIQQKPTFTANYAQAVADGLKVEGTISNAYTFTNTDDQMYFEVTTNSISPINDGSNDVIVYDRAKNTITAKNAGTATLTFIQPATDMTEAATASFTFTVSKLDNPMTVTLDREIHVNNEITIYLGDGIMVIPSSQHTDSPFEGQQLDGATFGTYYPSSNAFYAAATTGTAHCQITQAETYKYAAGSADFYVHVAEFTGTCNALEIQSGDIRNTSKSWPLTGVGDQLYWSLSGDKVVIEVSNTGNDDWYKIVPENYNVNPVSMDAYPNAKYIRVRSWTALSRNYSLYVTRNQFIKPSVENLYPKKILKGGTATATFDIDYSVCDETGYYTYDEQTYYLDKRIRLQSNNTGKITMSPDGVPGTANPSGKQTITVTYHSDEVGTDNAILAVYNRAERQRVFVYAETIEKWTPTALWNYGVDEQVFYLLDGDQIPDISATDDNGDTMTKVQWNLTSSNTNVATIVDGKIHPVGVGTTTITAYVVANETCYQSLPVTQNIYISNGTTITLNPNGGTGDNTVHVGYGKTTLDNTPSMSRTGYALNGFYTASTGGILVVNTAAQLQPNTLYTDGNSRWISKEAAATLYAQWTAFTSTVSFNRNGHGGTGALSSVTATYDANMPTLPTSHILSEKGHKFLGYWDDATAGTQYYTETGASARTWDKLANATLYAHWKGDDYYTWTTHFYANGTVPSNAAQPYSQLGVTYTSSNPAIVSVDADGKTMFAHKAGSVDLTATTAQDPTGYYSVITETKTITIDSCKQTVIFPKFETFYADELTGKFVADIVLNMASVVDSTNAPIGHNIHFAVVSGSDIATITENSGVYTLHINCPSGSGTATVKAYVLADTVYKYAATTQDIVIKPNAEPCNTQVIDNTQHTLNSRNPSFLVNLNSVPYKELAFDVSEGWIQLSAALSITGTDIHGVTRTYEALQEGDATHITVDLRGDTLQSLTFSTSSATILSGTYYISNIVVTQSQYLKASIERIEEQPYISDLFSKDFTVTYSDKTPIHAVITNHNGMVLTRVELDANDCGYYGTYHYSVSTTTSSLDVNKVMKDTIYITTPAGDRDTIPIQLTYVLGELYQFASGDYDLTKTLDWEDLNNWYLGRQMGVIIHPDHLPTIKNTVQLLNSARISSHVEVYGIERGEYTPSDAKIIIAPTGGLTVYNGDIKGRDKYSGNIIIEATQQHQGYLRISPKGTYTPISLSVVSQFATKSTLSTGANKDATWQYFGVPANGADFRVDYNTWLYQWSEHDNWVDLRSKSQPVHLEPFQGYAITQYGQPTYSFTGPIFMKDTTITLTYTEEGMQGQNLIANSFTAPIDAKRFTIEDFEMPTEDAMDYTFYIFNSGSWNQWNKQAEAGTSLDNDAPGTYTAIPALGAKMLGNEAPTLIAPMQGIYIQTYQPNCSITLDYAKHVWYAAPLGELDNMNNPMRAPQRRAVAEEENPAMTEIEANIARERAIRDSLANIDQQAEASLNHRVRLNVYGENSGSDHLYLLEKDAFTPNYDNGYDAYKMWAENGSAEIYTTEQAGQAYMSVSATNQLEGMYVGFGSSDASYYKLSVSSVIGNSLYLKDLTNNVEIPLVEGETYYFNQTSNTYEDFRFMVVRHEEHDTPTSDDQILDNMYIWTDKHNLHIENASASSLANLYAADGKLLVSKKIAHSAVINIDHLPNSVYLVNVDGKQMKFVKE
ncbi:MAG: InlB B-repeat-containing protein [Paludibacteraceae bacterium]|nr:InlB B-repeat-containing protein [Paludibacteraceae bacterium]